MLTIAMVTLVVSAFACCTAAAYRAWWRRRYGAPPPSASGATRIMGWVRFVRERADQHRSFELETAAGARHTVAVDPGVAADAVRVGEWVTVDGIPRAVQRVAAEELYREAACVHGLDATRVTRGAWPALRWSVPVSAGLGALAIVAFAVGQLTIPAGERLVAETASKTSCPLGTVRDTRVGPDGVLHRCRDARGRLHGAYTMWDWSGALVERGNYVRDAREGARDVLRRGAAHWILQRMTYHLGRLHGPSYELLDPEGAQVKRYHAEFANGVLHGKVRAWNEDGSPDYVGEYRCGHPCGKHTHWILSDTGGGAEWTVPFDDSAALPACEHLPATCRRRSGPAREPDADA